MKLAILLATVLFGAVFCLGAPAQFADPIPATGPASRPAATRVVFLLDGSGTMQACWDKATAEVAKSIDGLPATSRFSVVIATGDGPIVMPGGMVAPSEKTKDAAWAFLQASHPKGTGQFLGKSVTEVVRLGPDLVYFVSDGTSNGAPDEEFAGPFRDARKTMRRPFVVNTSLAFFTMDSNSEKAMKAIALESGGECIGRDGRPIDLR